MIIATFIPFILRQRKILYCTSKALYQSILTRQGKAHSRSAGWDEPYQKRKKDNFGVTGKQPDHDFDLHDTQDMVVSNLSIRNDWHMKKDGDSTDPVYWIE
jgi:hypothetical protein